MDILYLLIPMSMVLVLLILGIFAWALHAGQFDELDREGERVLWPEHDHLDQAQGRGVSASKKLDSPRVNEQATQE